MSILAIIRTETYRFITSRETIVGSYIMLDRYEVQTQTRSGGKGKIACVRACEM